MNRTDVYRDHQLIENCMRMGEKFSASQMFGLANPDQGFVYALEMVTSGRTVFEMISLYWNIQNNVTKKASAMLAHFNELGGVHTIRQWDSEVVAVDFQYNNQSLQVRLTYEDALKERWPYKKNGVDIKDNWATPQGRRSMLFARVTTMGIRAICPQVNAGTYAPEELDPEVPTPTYTVFGSEEAGADHNVIQIPVDAPCSQDQINRIQQLGEQIMAYDPDIINKVKSRLNSMGLQKLSDLKWQDAVELEQALAMKMGALHFEGKSNPGEQLG